MESGNSATIPFDNKPRNSINPASERLSILLFFRLLRAKKTDRLINIIIVFSSILLDADQVTKGIETQNSSGIHASDFSNGCAIFSNILPHVFYDKQILQQILYSLSIRIIYILQSCSQ